VHNKIVALVTGATRGLGFEASRQLAGLGYTVLIGARDIDKGRSVAAELAEENLDAVAVQLDVSDSSSIDAVVALIEANYGRLDILVNNAAILNDIGKQPSEVDEQTLRQNLDVNFVGPYLLTKKLSPLIKAAPAGRVLNMGTQVGAFANLADPESPIKDDICPAYQASKIALNSSTVLFAKEFAGTTARINSVCPGWVMTDMGHEDLPDYGDAVKPLSPAEAVAAYMFLLKSDNKTPNGQFFNNGKNIAW